MPTGVAGQRLMANVPAAPWEVNEGLFFQLTQKSEQKVDSFAYPGPSTSSRRDLPHHGILSEIRILFEGSVSGAGAGVADPLWAYNLIQDVRFTASGQTDLVSCRGLDLHALRFVKYPALNRFTEFFSTTPDENGNFRVLWIVPLAADPITLKGAIWAQSEQQQLSLEIRWASLASLGLTGATISGKVTLFTTVFEAPFHPGKPGTIVIPDLRVIHGIVTRDERIAGTGPTFAEISPLVAQLMRLFVYTDLGNADGTPDPVDYAAATQEVEELEFVFGGRNTPLSYSPAWVLAAKNAEHYSGALPTGYVVLDFVRENPARDTVILPGITDPRIRVAIASGTTIEDNAHVHLVHEVLYLTS